MVRAQRAVLILRSRPKAGVAKDGGSWFETRRVAALLTMRRIVVRENG
jgi:hypothetical protein